MALGYRLTRGQLLLARKPSPLQPSRLPLEYSLLQPRSALAAAPPWRAPRASKRGAATPPYSQNRLCKQTELPHVLWDGIDKRLEQRPFSGPTDSAGELLRTPWRMPASMATVLLSRPIDSICGIA